MSWAPDLAAGHFAHSARGFETSALTMARGATDPVDRFVMASRAVSAQQSWVLSVFALLTWLGEGA